jgi:DUF4097 and DUF4098 domain-containing protein YvlB
MRNVQPWKASLVVTLLAAVAVCCPAFAANQTANKKEIFDRTLPLSAGAAFSLNNVNGSISVEGWDRDAVEIYAVKTAKQSADLALVRIDTDAEPGRVAVSTIDPQGNDAEVSVDYTVRVPRRIVLEQLATVNGAVHVSGVEGQGELRSVNGDISVASSEGGFSAHTTNGGIHVELLHLAAPNSLALETVNGSIVLMLPHDSQATVDARSLNGGFHSDLPVALLSAYSPRGIRGQLSGGGAPVQLRTVNGMIRIAALTQRIL